MGVEDQGEKRASGTRAFGTPEPALPSQHGQGRAVPAAATPAPAPVGTGAPASAPPSAPTQMQMPPEPDGDPLVGQTLAGRYQIERKLGEGGMGAVYLGLHVALEKRVALKVLHGEFVRKPDLIERFLQEAKAASKIRHDNVIDITDFGQTDDGLVFFAMELLDGSDLAEVLGHARLTDDRLPWPRTRHIFLQICAALAAAHNKGIIHRDLKPENIYLVERLGQKDFVKLLDFGIAKLTEVNDEGRKLTKTGMLFGTPEYMSPEQARGEKVDLRVDIYAMGCILFQMVTGHVPFEADNFMGILTMHLTQETPLMGPALAETGAPPELENIVQKALAKEKEHRYGSIEELVGDILALNDGLGDALEPVPRAASHIGSGAVAAAPAGPARTQWTGSVKLHADPGATESVDAIPGKGGAGKWIAIAAVAAIAVGGGIFMATRGGGGDDEANAAKPSVEETLPPGGDRGVVTPPPVDEVEQVTIVITSEPRGADIIDVSTGEVIAKTPVPFKVDKSDEIRVYSVTLDGYKTEDIQVTPNANFSTEVKLDKKRSKRDRHGKRDKRDDKKDDSKADSGDKGDKGDATTDTKRDSKGPGGGLKSFEDAMKSGSKKKPGEDL